MEAAGCLAAVGIVAGELAGTEVVARDIVGVAGRSVDSSEGFHLDVELGIASRNTKVNKQIFIQLRRTYICIRIVTAWHVGMWWQTTFGN